MERAADIFLDYLQPHWQRLHAVARQYVTKENAADLVQETLLRAWRNFSPVESRTYHRAWLLVIMRNVVLEWQRTAKRRVRLVVLPDVELTEMAADDFGASLPALPAMDEERFREFLDDRLAAALDGLEPVFREVIVLSVAGELTYREIAEILNCPMGTVMSRMGRARRTLREKLADVAGARGWLREGRS